MGVRSKITSLIISGLIMAIIWEISESGAIRNVTESFVGKIGISIFVIILAGILGSILSGGKH